MGVEGNYRWNNLDRYLSTENQHRIRNQLWKLTKWFTGYTKKKVDEVKESVTIKWKQGPWPKASRGTTNILLFAGNIFSGIHSFNKPTDIEKDEIYPGLLKWCRDSKTADMLIKKLPTNFQNESYKLQSVGMLTANVSKGWPGPPVKMCCEQAVQVWVGIEHFNFNSYNDKNRFKKLFFYLYPGRRTLEEKKELYAIIRDNAERIIQSTGWGALADERVCAVVKDFLDNDSLDDVEDVAASRAWVIAAVNAALCAKISRGMEYTFPPSKVSRIREAIFGIQNAPPRSGEAYTTKLEGDYQRSNTGGED
eukprot:GHVQ01001305.1.p1 GENE.GHVQ01001305.1~~GHVQ01001305.1.p1  ORF type:complete len:308 (-),score=19.59 GHVQ01001305.1:932-1855(-)